jgi:hypothetical protein
MLGMIAEWSLFWDNLIWDDLRMMEEVIGRNIKKSTFLCRGNCRFLFVLGIGAIILSHRMMEVAGRMIILKRPIIP